MPIASRASPVPVIQGFKCGGRVDAVLSTAVRKRNGFQTAPVSMLRVDLEGIAENRHRGWTRAADARVPYITRGTPIRNDRQLSLVAVEDLTEMARRLDVALIEPGWLGANVVVAGIERFSWLPRGTRLFSSGGAVLVVTDQNAPCRLAGAAVAGQTSGRDDITFAFAKLAAGLRGVVAAVEHPGQIAPGTALTARLPDQWIYYPTDAAQASS